MKTYAVKVPRQGVVREGVGIITLNHVGSSIRQDSGRDAQALANTFQVMTIAANRPTSHALPRNHELAKQLSKDAVDTMAKLAQDIDRIASLNGLRKLIIAGRSAGGLDALELARTEKISDTSHLYVAEPVGCETMTPHAGLNRFKTYQTEQKKWFEEDTESRLTRPNDDAKDLPLTSRIGRIATMVPLFLTDKYYNQEHWNQPVVWDHARYIAKSMPRLTTTIEFAEHSMVADQPTIDTALHSLPQLRDDGSFIVKQVTGTTHASFDNRDFFADRLSPFVADALDATR